MPRNAACVILWGVVMLMGCDHPSGARQNSNRPPLVRIQPSEDGNQAVTYQWDHHGDDMACFIPLPNPTTKPVTLRFRQVQVDGSLVGVLFLDSEYAIEVGKIQSDLAMIFVRPGDIIPYHDQLYLVTFDRVSLVIKCVTHTVPESYRPDPEHLVIPRTEPLAIRDRLFLLKRDDWSDYERVRVTHVAVDGSHAEYQGKPYYGSAQGVRGDHAIKLNQRVHQWAGSATDVAAIVPPVDIQGVGKLRGWVAFRQTRLDE